MKLLQTVILFAGLLALAWASNATYGTKYAKSVLASTQNVTVNATKGVYHLVSVNFPVYGERNTKIISFINVTDRFTNSSGALPQLIAGGPGFTFATINLLGQTNQGINSSLQFWVQN